MKHRFEPQAKREWPMMADAGHVALPLGTTTLGPSRWGLVRLLGAEARGLSFPTVARLLEEEHQDRLVGGALHDAGGHRATQSPTSEIDHRSRREGQRDEGKGAGDEVILYSTYLRDWTCRLRLPSVTLSLYRGRGVESDGHAVSGADPFAFLYDMSIP